MIAGIIWSGVLYMYLRCFNVEMCVLNYKKVLKQDHMCLNQGNCCVVKLAMEKYKQAIQQENMYVLFVSIRARAVAIKKKLVVRAI